MSRIVAMGGGEIADGQTRALDERAVDAAPGETPTALFLPTASGDAEGYVERFREAYGDELGCDVDVLRLTGEPPAAEARTAVADADLVYVGGGDTGYLVDQARTYGLVDALAEHRADGGVLAGLSAGALCWFDHGLSDAHAAEGVEYGPVSGFGFVEGLAATVHADFARRERFLSYLDARDGVGVALGDCTALEVDGDRWRIATCSPNAVAFHVAPGADDPVTPLPVGDVWRPLSALRSPAGPD